MEHSADLRTLLTHGASNFGLSLNEHQISQFLLYHQELIVWNKKVNLTAITKPKQIIIKHFLDSLAFSKAFQPLTSEDRFLDIGSGGGFPGLPLKVLYPELEMTLLEPSHKKTAFLRYIIGTLGLKRSQVVSKSLEDFSEQTKNHRKFSYATTRALNINSVIRYVEPLLAEYGTFILCRSRPIENVFDTDGFTITKEISYDLPSDYGRRVLTILQIVPRGTSIS